ncbi:MAG: TonB-dependent receptor [Candidatus Hydrogenedentota bacterium]|nr:MAG: TonB-dependent receptor [Candidatus Hydrogenedentota bacterium]
MRVYTFIFLLLFFLQDLFAQEAVQGQVLAKITKQPVAFATVAVLEKRIKVRCDEKGNFALNLEPGTYTILVQAPGYQYARQKIQIPDQSSVTILLETITVRGSSLVVRDNRNIQKVSRYTMTVQEMKEVPASFGDSVSALTALPGINRTAGFFGNLTIRGQNTNANRYYIDGIPVYSILHFGGLHSVINTNMIQQIDVYSSAYPVDFSNALGSVISIGTTDEVKEFYGYGDASIISSNVLLGGPFTRLVKTNADSENQKKQTIGYWIVSGRYGNLSIAKNIADLIGEKVDNFPIYYDYQAKGKLFFAENHALTLFFFGSSDFLSIVSDVDDKSIEEGADPLFDDIKLKVDNQFHNQAFTYSYIPSKKFSEKLLLYSSLNTVNTFAYRQNTFLDVDFSAHPNIFGVRNFLNFEFWQDVSKLSFITEAALYDFSSRGRTIARTNQRTGFNLADTNSVQTTSVDNDSQTTTTGVAIANEWKFGILKLVPQVRADYLALLNKTVIDPRGLISFEISQDTELSFAGGQYSSFAQINPFIFANNPGIASKTNFGPEKAYHFSAGIEHNFSRLYTIKVDTFYNTFHDLLEPMTVNNQPEYTNSGDGIAYGVETTLRKDTTTARNHEFFGWINYTYTQAKNRTNLADDPLGSTYIRNRFEQEHVVKLVLGYLWGAHTLTAKFQFYTSFPYTPIIGDDNNQLNLNPPRYAPVYDTDHPYSKHFEPAHRLDIRYSYQFNYRWGYIKLYVEVINVYAYAPTTSEKWKYNQRYQPGVNPTLEKDTGFSAIPIPNFGVEVRF